MTQTLALEAAWERQVSQQDRQLIEQGFKNVKDHDATGVVCTYLRHDINHAHALLVVVLVHNYKDEPSMITEQSVDCYTEDGGKVATRTFSLPFEIPEKTSMPWTFIFPRGNYEQVDIDSVLELSFGQ